MQHEITIELDHLKCITTVKIYAIRYRKLCGVFPNFQVLDC